MNKEDMYKQIEKFASAKGISITKLDISGFTALEISKSDIETLLAFLKEEPSLRFTILTDLFAADFPERAKRFEVVYNLLSLEFNTRIVIKVHLAEDEKINSVAKIFSAAIWYEREVFDMFGIVFDNSPDLRRILTDYGFIGHPLRKDFPVTGHLEVKYDERLERVIYQPVTLDQEFRTFDFRSPWHGPEYVLPGDEKAQGETKK
jgi:NADH-quinone oxidoreductase subunit C